MTERERRAASLFFICLGALGLIVFTLSIIDLSPPPTTTSPFRAGLASLLVSLLGAPAGHVVYHSVFALVSAFMVWLGIKLRSPSIGE